MRFVTKKPQEIEAVQWTGDNFDELAAQLGNSHIDRAGEDSSYLRLRAGKDGAQGWVPVPAGHWIVHLPDDLSDLWPVDPDYFAAKYKPIEASSGVDL